MGSIKGKDVLSDAAAGATAGSLFGPWGTAIGGAGGAIYGGLSDLFSSDPGPDPTQVAAQQKLDAMKAAGDSLAAYRPVAQQNRLNGMNAQLGLYNGAINTMQSMYGGQPPPPMRQMDPSGIRMPGDVPGQLGAHPLTPQLSQRQGAPPSMTMGAPHFPTPPQLTPRPLAGGGGAMGRPTFPGGGPPIPFSGTGPRPSMDDAISQLGRGR